MEGRNPNLRTAVSPWVSEISVMEIFGNDGKRQWAVDVPDLEEWRKKARALGPSKLGRRLGMTERNARRVILADVKSVVRWALIDSLENVEGDLS